MACASIVTGLWKLAGGRGFGDVPSSTAYAQTVFWAVEQGIINGTGGNARKAIQPF